MAAPLRAVGKLFLKSPLNSTVHRLRILNGTSKRFLLSSAYYLQTEWDERLREPMLNFDISDYMTKLNDLAEKEKGITSIDINLFANRLQDCDPTQMDNAKQLFYKFRHTQYAMYALDSTPYTLTRAYMQLNMTDDMIDIIQDKVNYGVFLDVHGASILMDHFIKQENYLDSCRVAYELMLQEELDHPLTRLLSLYSCHMNLRHPVAMDADADADEEVEEEAAATEEDGNIITYMRVPIVRNPHYDDHFDLVDDNLLLGKTLSVLGAGLEGVLGRNCRLVGVAYYRKFQEGLDLMAGCVKNGESISDEAICTYKSQLENVEVVEGEEANKPGLVKQFSQAMKDDYMQQLEIQHQALCDASLVTNDNQHDLVTSFVQDQLSIIEPEQIDDHRQKLQSWTAVRQEGYKKQCTREVHAKRKAEIIEQLRELKKKEELVNYFEKKDEIDLAKTYAPRVGAVKEEAEIEQTVKNLLQDPSKQRRVRKERDNRRDHKHENLAKYLKEKAYENYRR